MEDILWDPLDYMLDAVDYLYRSGEVDPAKGGWKVEDEPRFIAAWLSAGTEPRRTSAEWLDWKARVIETLAQKYRASAVWWMSELRDPQYKRKAEQVYRTRVQRDDWHSFLMWYGHQINADWAEERWKP